MGQFDIRIFGDPVLRQEARTVDTFDDRLERLAEDMLETMRTAAGVGLSANQVGVLKQLFTWELPGDEETPGEHGAVVNPVVEETSAEIQEGEEGCLSFPGLFYPLERPLRARIRHEDLGGTERVRELEGFLARVWLHEIDHLNGILFIDHLAAHDRKDALRRMREYRLHGPPDGDRVHPGDLPPDASQGGRRGSLLGRQSG